MIAPVASAAPTAAVSAVAAVSRRLRLPRRPSALRGLTVVLGGVLWYLSFPPRPVWWLAPVAFALFGVAVHGQRARAGFGYGFLFGLAFFLPLLRWTGTFVGAPPWLVLSVVEALFVAAAGAAIALLSAVRAWPVWAALVWVAVEGARGRVPFGGFPWGDIGLGQSDGTYLSLAALGGAALIALAVTLTGFGLAALAVSVRRTPRRWQALAGPAAGFALPLVAAAGAWPLVGTDPNAGSVTVAAIQGNVPRLGLDFNAQRRAVLDNHVRETERLAAQIRAHRQPQPQLVVWPENSSDIDPYTNPDAYAEISRAAKDIGVPIMVGAVVYTADGRPQNTVILWDPQRGPVATYVKRKLQPFGEYMPLRSLLRHFNAAVNRAGNFKAGSQPVGFTVGPATVSIDTCYEVAFDGVVRDSVTATGATLMTVPTNNATFGYGEMTYQQLAMDRERAVEHGRAVVVAATSGVSAIIQPDGTVTAQTAIFTPAALVATVPLRSTRTVADRLGGWPEAVMALGGVLATAYVATSRLRRVRAARR